MKLKSVMCVYYPEFNFFLKVSSAHTIDKEHEDKIPGLQRDQLLTNSKLVKISLGHYVHLQASCDLAERTPLVHLLFMYCCTVIIPTHTLHPSSTRSEITFYCFRRCSTIPLVQRDIWTTIDPSHFPNIFLKVIIPAIHTRRHEQLNNQ